MVDHAIRALTPRRFWLITGAFLLVLVLCFLAGVLFGPGGLPFDSARLLDSRLQRTLLAVLVGGALSAVGVAFQALLRNPLADPFIMGVSGGAAVGGTLALVLLGGGLSSSLALEGPAAFVGAVLATFLVYSTGRVAGRVDTLTVLLVGVIFNSFASAVITFLKSVVSATKNQEILSWLMGTLGYRSYPVLIAVGVGVAAGIGILFTKAAAMNAMTIGEQGASHLGVDVERTKVVIFFAASLLVALAVAVSGMVGFVGLIVPHVVRLLLGPDHRLLLPASVLGGAAFLVLADLLARLAYVLLSTEIPVGVVTAFLGGPFFLILLRRRHQAAWIA